MNSKEELERMKKIRSSLPDNIKEYLFKLGEYLDTDLYFYGSINRPDYHHGQSDIDIAIFTDNMKSTLTKLQHKLHVKENDFSKVEWKLNNIEIYAYKIKCDKFIDIKCEIAIYNKKDIEIVLDDLKKYNSIPWYLLGSLFILKTFYYTLQLINKKQYNDYKVLIFNTLSHKKNSDYQVIKQK
uniref:Polymerase nucleotidyl transferase domain-containing protein n=1 Tax=viral metagenome TaxID=1070528 RepID=A0A6C0KPC1_9ZZZZ